MERLPTINFDRTPAEVSFDCLRFANKHLGVADPFKKEKDLYTQKMHAIEDDMRRDILAAPDPLRAAIHFALAGNMIDLGIVETDHVEGELARDAANLELAIDHYELLRAALAEARSVLYLLDNAGEVICDKLVIEQLHVPEITCVVRAAPIINDVTRDDIDGVGLERLAKIVDIGADVLGVPLGLCSAEFRDLFASADVVISKGQANFETLDTAEREIFHILRAKCEHMASYLGVARGAAVLVRTPRQSDSDGPESSEN